MKAKVRKDPNSFALTVARRIAILDDGSGWCDLHANQCSGFPDHTMREEVLDALMKNRGEGK